MTKLELPLNPDALRNLAIGESVLLTGTIYTARDAAHKFLANMRLGDADAGAGRVPALAGAVLYHCGPVIVKDGESYRVTAAGPTTSIREEPYMAAIIAKYGIRAIIGKGGMGPSTLAACQEHTCVYLHAVGGAAQILASCVKAVTNVYMLEEFGAPEAIWEMQVVDFPVIVTMDAHGHSLHADVLGKSQAKYKELLS